MKYIRYFLLAILLTSTSVWGRRSVTWKYGELVVSDDDFTFAVLRYLMTPSVNDEDALNDSVFWEICKISDGALSEALTDYLHDGLKAKPGIIARLIGNESHTKAFMDFFSGQCYYYYYADYPHTRETTRDKNFEAEKVFNRALSDLKEYITEEEYRYLLQLKPEIIKEMMGWI